MWYRLDNFKVNVKNIPVFREDLDSGLTPYIAEYCGMNQNDIAEYHIVNKSIDARGAGPVIVYSIDLKLKDQLKGASPLVEIPEPEKESYLDKIHPMAKLPVNPIIVGTGPAGLFAAYLLAAFGCKPILIERGYDVERRTRDIDLFHTTRELDPNSNYLIGEGGAGTFSDGKLYTRTRDPRGKFVLEIFVENGAPQEILYLKRPHIGSDILPGMIKNMREKIKDMGGIFVMGNTVYSAWQERGICKGISFSDGEKLNSQYTIIAQGLGGRELARNLMNQNIEHSLKSFQIGCRIEHPQVFIDTNQYGLKTRPPFLGAAEYNLVSRPAKNSTLGGVTTFCMCPGGEIVPGTATPGQFSTNGMSNYARNGKFANSALIVSQDNKLFQNASQAFDMLATLETNAYLAGGEDYTAPAQDAAAFFHKRRKISSYETSYKLGLRPAPLHEILPRETSWSITNALSYFERIFPGFMRFGKLVGVETNISSPVRFFRNPETLESSLPGLYICGEGAGFAGGIMSAAVDGMKIAEKIITGK